MPIIDDIARLTLAVERMDNELNRLNKIVQGSGVIVAHGTKFDIDKSARVSEILNNIAAALTEKHSHSAQDHIADPTGGATADAECRAAVVSILSALETLGFLKPA